MIQSRDSKGRAAPAAPDTETTRFCPECNAYRPKSEFYADERARGGLTRRCRTHHSRKSYESRRKYESPAKRYEYARRQMLRKKYGLTVEEYFALSEAQGNVCKICKQPELRQYRMLHVDHCHRSNRVRGLLCTQCNTALGKFYDDPELLKSAMAYLEAHEQAVNAP